MITYEVKSNCQRDVFEHDVNWCSKFRYFKKVYHNFSTFWPWFSHSPSDKPETKPKYLPMVGSVEA